MKEIVTRINEIRKHYNLSGRAFAKEIDMKYTTINNYLNGTQDPTLDFILHIKSKFLDISYDWLLNGEGEMFKADEPTSEKLIREIADLKMKLLVKEGVTKELRNIILEKNGQVSDERKSLVG